MKNKLPDLVIDDLVVNPPIIQGGMGVRVSVSKLASAVANEGAMGVITSVGLGENKKQHLNYVKRSHLTLEVILMKVLLCAGRMFSE